MRRKSGASASTTAETDRFTSGLLVEFLQTPAAFQIETPTAADAMSPEQISNRADSDDGQGGAPGILQDSSTIDINGPTDRRQAFFGDFRSANQARRHRSSG